MKKFIAVGLALLVSMVSPMLSAAEETQVMSIETYQHELQLPTLSPLDVSFNLVYRNYDFEISGTKSVNTTSYDSEANVDVGILAFKPDVTFNGEYGSANVYVELPLNGDGTAYAADNCVGGCPGTSVSTDFSYFRIGGSMIADVDLSHYGVSGYNGLGVYLDYMTLETDKYDSSQLDGNVQEVTTTELGGIYQHRQVINGGLEVIARVKAGIRTVDYNTSGTDTSGMFPIANKTETSHNALVGALELLLNYSLDDNWNVGANAALQKTFSTFSFDSDYYADLGGASFGADINDADGTELAFGAGIAYSF